MTNEQSKYGIERLSEYADRHKISAAKAAEILDDTKGFNEFWRWTDADEFLNLFVIMMKTSNYFIKTGEE